MDELRQDDAVSGNEAPAPTGLRLVSLLIPSATRRRVRTALAGGHLRTLDQVDLLAEASLRELAPASLYLLIGGGIVFVALDILARTVQSSGPLLGAGSPLQHALVLLGANVLSYALILPLHEGVHAAVILLLGGSPRFGLKLPFAAYCTAPGQIFTRNGYLAIALAPLIVLSVLEAVATWLWPDVGACILLGIAGNISGAVGDLASSQRLLRLPASTLVTDTDSGFVAYAPE